MDTAAASATQLSRGEPGGGTVPASQHWEEVEEAEHSEA